MYPRRSANHVAASPSSLRRASSASVSWTRSPIAPSSSSPSTQPSIRRRRVFRIQRPWASYSRVFPLQSTPSNQFPRRLANRAITINQAIRCHTATSQSSTRPWPAMASPRWINNQRRHSSPSFVLLLFFFVWCASLIAGFLCMHQRASSMTCCRRSRARGIDTTQQDRAERY
ncbi:hypothetical protein SCHPADRAFT_556292 [Schizopora paradoxa]|uniref:Uncharacterized protein n=1 Tax=Schizopora paradoxa TaxID=27342 RepID=A0A0H2RCZ5_9AGAM|nr:hypothetical protein SCHPADRAFT_556292 [Schizopora paradoxa]